jgi:hypothetical protein
MKVKREFVTNSSSVSFIFEDKRRKTEPINVYFPGITLDLSKSDLGVGLETYESYGAFERWSDNPADIKPSEVMDKSSFIHIVGTFSDNLAMFIMIEKIGEGTKPKFDEGVRLIKWIDQGEEKFIEGDTSENKTRFCYKQ